MKTPRSAGALKADFPYTLQTMCYVEVHQDGTVRFGHDGDAYERARSGESRLFAVWPGEWSSDMFAIDDLDEYARAFGIVHDEKRTGLAAHQHDVTWRTDPHESKPNGSYVGIELRLACGCEVNDLATFARQMGEQQGWDVATSRGWGSRWSAAEGKTYSVRVRRTTLRRR
ncbi:hypothetical protein [Saccharothrix texasensis]|uniref:Uncharacterized protein n=1 Tax=Saccharothrix texasensis TaxID=103734 RepID=A0A3N1H969_9PSEU|nr:hypothetical protein [Saccharothrix texasensis]ROP39064.1 hypothetical protein EDD40_4434 [Saccharothrix texasensis]